MRLTPPTVAVWTVALVLGLLGILLKLSVLRLPALGIEAFWLVGIAFLLLLVAPLVKGM
jgi:hypothetical protein